MLRLRRSIPALAPVIVVLALASAPLPVHAADNSGADASADRIGPDPGPRRDALEAPERITVEIPSWRKGAVGASYLSLYAGATKVGSRFGLERRFEVVRLESAYVYDLVAHVWAVREIGGLFAAANRWGGMSPDRARIVGAWGAGFGALTYMEIINGFMPGVRFDPWDPPANALGAWLASDGSAFADRYPWLRRLSFEFGYKDWGRVFGPPQVSGTAGNIWHDYPNGRYALGYGLGPENRDWARLFLSYEITSFELQDLENRIGIGLELKPHEWLSSWAQSLPGGGRLLGFLRWWDRRLLLPGLYLQLWTLDLGAFSDREPFHE